MRGKAFSSKTAATSNRITPAYAGKRQGELNGNGSGRDHPRVCGEKVPVGSKTMLAAGSPLRVRGKV